MTRRISPLNEENLALTSTFLREIFRDREVLSFADPDVLRWKYLEAGPLSAGSRAFVVEHDGAIVACAGFAPAVFSVPSVDGISTLTAIDWSASPTAPGAGLAVFNHIIRLAQTAFHIGGAEVTRAIVPKLGFKPAGQAIVYARWIRPVREFLVRKKEPRSFARLGHGLLKTVRFQHLVGGSWQADRVERFESTLERILRFRPNGRILCRRSVASLNHMLACPIARMEAYVLSEREMVRGYLIVAYKGWEARIVDLNIDSESLAEWVGAYGMVMDLVKHDPFVCRVSAQAVDPLLCAALEGNAFWISRREPVLLFDPSKLVPTTPLDVQFFESDSAYT